MNILFQIKQLTKKSVYFFVPIQIFLCIVTLCLSANTQNESIMTDVLFIRADGIIEIMLGIMHFISLVFSLYIVIGEELSPFANFIFVKTKKIYFLIRKNFVLFLYSIMVSIYLSLEYIFIKKFVINFDLSTSFFITYIVYLYIIYLMTYMTAFMFNSNQISIIVLILILALIIIYNINIFNIIDYLINKPIVLVFIIVIVILKSILFIFICLQALLLL